jgi:hypothetical protein
MLDRALAAEHGDRPTLALAMAGISLSADGDEPRAARLRGAVAGLRDHIGQAASTRDQELESRFEQPLIDALGRESYDAELETGTRMSLEETIELARTLAAS